MKSVHKTLNSLFLISIFLYSSAQLLGQEVNREEHKDRPERKERPERKDRSERKEGPNQKGYNIEQAISERAQLNTTAFSGLAFITGSFGGDTFFPPGKVADYFGFQFMRDNDKNMKGHNTDFLTSIANNVISILTPEQLKDFTTLANQQASIYDEFARKRFVLIKAFREALNGKQLNKEAVIKYCSSIYELDAELSYNRAIEYGKLAKSLSEEQKKSLAKLDFSNSSTWQKMPEKLDKRSMSHRAHVAVMTYASEFFSWYAGSVTADVYFCPERHATYFGGFFLKDYPAMGNPNYSISTKLTGDKGEQFTSILTQDQSNCLFSTVKTNESLLKEIVSIRESVSKEFRKTLNSESIDREKVFNLIKRYGVLDGEISYNCAICFSSINKTLSEDQKKKLQELRDLAVVPKGVYLYSDPIEMPSNIDCNFLLK